MDTIKRFIDIPVTTCTLRCHYCYITQHHLFSNKLPNFKYSPEQVGKELSKERLKGVCLINLFMHGKLRDSNQEYSEEEKNRVNRLNKLAKYENRAKSALIRIKSLITR